MECAVLQENSFCAIKLDENDTSVEFCQLAFSFLAISYDSDMSQSEKFSRKISTGGPRVEGELYNGVPEGRWTFRYPSGSVFQRGNYQRGRRTGTWFHFMPNGVLAARVVYSAGRIQRIEWNHANPSTFFYSIDAIFRS